MKKNEGYLHLTFFHVLSLSQRLKVRTKSASKHWCKHKGIKLASWICVYVHAKRNATNYWCVWDEVSQPVKHHTSFLCRQWLLHTSTTMTSLEIQTFRITRYALLSSPRFNFFADKYFNSFLQKAVFWLLEAWRLACWVEVRRCCCGNGPCCVARFDFCSSLCLLPSSLECSASAQVLLRSIIKQTLSKALHNTNSWSLPPFLNQSMPSCSISLWYIKNYHPIYAYIS